MIKLVRNFTPLILNPETVSELTKKFKEEGKNVWNNDELKSELLRLSYGKCAYCECKLGTESKFMEVEHFEDKYRYPDKVLKWNNLLPSCKRCNGSKGTHDVNHEPIINPTDIDPPDHLIIRLYRLKGKTGIGENTIEVLDLNNSERAVYKRFEIGNAIEDSIKDASEKLERYKQNESTRSKNRLLAHVEGLLNECLPESDYSAICSSVLHSEEFYKELKYEMEKLDLWPHYLEIKHVKSIKITLSFD